MIIEYANGGLSVRREGVERYPNTAAGESHLLYHVKLALNAAGFELIKKLAWKDGNMVADTQHYLRVRGKTSKAPHVYIYDGAYDVRKSTEDFNAGRVWLPIEYDIYEAQPDCKQMVRDLLAKPLVWSAGQLWEEASEYAAKI